MQKAEPIAPDPLERRMLSLREGLETAVQQLAAEALDPAALEQVDICLLEWRWIESHLARLAQQIARQTALAIDDASGRRPSATGDLVKRWLRSRLQQRQHSDQETAKVLLDGLAESHRLLVLIIHHREFLQRQLILLEQELEERFTQLQSIPVGKGDPAAAISVRIDVLQDLVDGVIDMTASANLFYNKILVDSEANILALTSLEAGRHARSDFALPHFDTLRQRAERGLLSVRGIAHRRAVLDEAFQRKLSTTRQAGH
ncbi:hypothetical protein [Rhizobium sp. FKY42]|uniref:hypothetical protein n=1 Tax=Rhizobium sp. FKY42 TaxID=2562310 RepID=UPI0010C0BD3E|nr:hypothetical protein [Rhizobium sp. FKY42]